MGLTEEVGPSYALFAAVRKGPEADGIRPVAAGFVDAGQIYAPIGRA